MSLTQNAQKLINLGKGGTYSLARDAIKHQLWDTRTFGTAVADFTFFSQPVGSAWRNNSVKTVNETNLADSGKLPNGQTFLVMRMGIGLISLFAADDVNAADVIQAFTNLIQSSYFEIKVAGRDFDYQVHGRQFLPAIMVHGDNVSTVNSSHSCGEMLASAWLNLDPSPIFLDQLVSFNVVHRLNNPDANVVSVLNANSSLLSGMYATMQVTLEGFLTRAK